MQFTPGLNKKIIVVIGGGILQIPLIKASCRRDYQTIVIDGNKQAPGRELTADFIYADIANPAVTLKSLRKYLKKRPTGVLTVGTDFTYTVALINEYYALKAVSVPSAQKATDKVAMREAFKASGIPQPNFTFFEAGDSPTDANIPQQLDIAGLNWPLVVKPADNMGARGSLQISHPTQLEKGLQFALSYSKKGKVIIEEYIAGSEFSIDALVNNGEIYIHGLADRIISPPPYFVEWGHVMPSQVLADTKSKIVAGFKQAIYALGIRHGYAKGDIFFNKGQVYIGEVAARLSGGFMSGFTYAYSTGLDLMDLALDIAMDCFAENPKPRWEKGSIEKAIICHQPGKIAEIKGIDQVKKEPGVKDVFVHYHPGQVISPPKNNVEKGGHVIVVGETYEKARSLSDWALGKIKVRLEMDGSD